MVFRSVIVSFFFASLFLSASSPNENKLHIVDGVADGLLIEFEVYDKSLDTLFYRGHESISIEDGLITKITVYFDPNDNQEVQREEGVYSIDDLHPKSFLFSNSKTGEKTSFSMDGDKLKISHSAASGRKPDSAELKWGNDFLFGKALHHAIVRGWDKLLDGGRQRFDIIVASRLTSYRFQVVRNRTETRGSAKMEVIRLEPQSWLVRRFVDAMDFYYQDTENGPLLKEYHGPTTIAINGDASVDVVIKFSYKFP